MFKVVVFANFNILMVRSPFLSSGKNVRYTQGLYFRMKDLVFVGRRPYDEKPLEEILKTEFGETAVMSEIKGPKYVLLCFLH